VCCPLLVNTDTVLFKDTVIFYSVIFEYRQFKYEVWSFAERFTLSLKIITYFLSRGHRIRVRFSWEWFVRFPFSDSNLISNQQLSFFKIPVRIFYFQFYTIFFIEKKLVFIFPASIFYACCIESKEVIYKLRHAIFCVVIVVGYLSPRLVRGPFMVLQNSRIGPQGNFFLKYMFNFLKNCDFLTNSHIKWSAR
jgi:hypothetical protein